MSRIITLEQAQALTGQQRHWAYNSLDTIGTRHIYDTLSPRLDPVDARTYAFERASQGPAFAMSTRGIKVDLDARDDAVRELKAELRRVEREVNKLDTVAAFWDGQELVTGQCPHSSRKDGRHTWERGVADTPARTCVSCGASRFKRSAFNPNSHDQCKHLLYDILNLKRQFNKDGAVSADDEALDRLGRKYPKHLELTTAIRSSRGLAKQIGFLKTRLSPAGRFTSNFSVGQAWTGRWSAAHDPFGDGGNAQNIAERHRKMFIADPGYELWYADLKQAESNLVAHLAGDEGYIEAHRSGDVHTYVTRLVWPDLSWTGDLALDKAIAKSLPEWDPVPGHDFRFQAKRIQHGSNYGLTPFGIAIIGHIPVEAARTSQRAYFRAFPGIPEWQRTIRVAVEAGLPLTSPLGIRTRLFGRPWDEHTYKQGLSLLPQGTVAHIINIAAWRIWMELDLQGRLMLLAQVHDALVGQSPLGAEGREALRQAMALMTIPLPITDIAGKTRIAQIEVELAVGTNWGHAGKDNPGGIRELVF